MIKLFKNQKGQVVSIFTFFALIIMVGMALTMSFLISLSQRNITNDVKSTQSYYAAESGIEDALLRLKKTPSISSLTYIMNVNNALVSVNIPSTIAASKSITSQANNGNIIRSIQAVCTISNSQSTNFYYGVEVGEGGLVMSNGSEVIGNVFSGGNISGGSGIIDNDAIVSGNGKSISNVHVKGNAMAYSCLSGATVDGNLTYVTGGLHTCTVHGTTTAQSQEISAQPLPIPQSQINDWKAAARAGGTSGSKTINGSDSLGPIKIDGDLIINTGVHDTLTINGTVYVTGRITIQNNSNITLSPSYATAGGVIISDGNITINNNDVFSGSGQAGSYIMLISTSTDDLAIDVKNNAQGVVLYTTSGGITIHNNVSVTEATGYKVILLQNAKIQYSSGIVNIYFASGPGGGWEVTSWQEQ